VGAKAHWSAGSLPANQAMPKRESARGGQMESVLELEDLAKELPEGRSPLPGCRSYGGCAMRLSRSQSTGDRAARAALACCLRFVDQRRCWMCFGTAPGYCSRYISRSLPGVL